MTVRRAKRTAQLQTPNHLLNKKIRMSMTGMKKPTKKSEES